MVIGPGHEVLQNLCTAKAYPVGIGTPLTMRSHLEVIGRGIYSPTEAGVPATDERSTLVGVITRRMSWASEPTGH